MIRTNNKIVDSWKCIDALLNKYQSTSAPWTSWKVIKGYPESNVFTDLGTPIIFTEPPVKTLEGPSQHGGEKSQEYLDMRIGIWDDRKTGGIEEISIISGRILDLFGNFSTVHTATFDVTLGSAFSNTTLLNQGMRVEGITGPRSIETVNQKEFRNEFVLRLRV